MNWKTTGITIVAASVCFGGGLLTGSILFQKLGPSQQSETVAPNPSESALPLSTSPTELSTAHVPAAPSSSNGVLGAISTPQKEKSASVADLEAALRSARSRWDLGKIYQAMDALDADQFGEAISTCLKAVDSFSKSMVLQALGSRWGRTDPQGALAFAETLANSPQRIQLMASIMFGWTEKDSNAALDWAKQLPAGQAKNQALSAIASSLATQNPRAAVALMDSLPANRARQGMINPVFNEWANRSPVEAAAAAL